MPRRLHTEISRIFNSFKQRVNNKVEFVSVDVAFLGLESLSFHYFEGIDEGSVSEINADSNCFMEIPEFLFHFRQLRVLSLNENELYFVPPSIGSLLCLEELRLAKNRLSNLPESLKGCRQLQVLDISANSLSGLPDVVVQLVSLTELYLNDLKLDLLPSGIGRLTSLSILELRGNKLEALPSSFSRLSRLERLDLCSNRFAKFPAVISRLVSLKELWCASNDIMELPMTIGDLSQLEFLDVSRNIISRLPDEIYKLSRLAHLDLSFNQLIQLPFTLGSLSCLSTLSLQDNQLRTLPESIGNLHEMTELNLASNQLKQLPSTVGSLIKLAALICDNNQLKRVPLELSNCTSLRLLSLTSNQLTSLPEQLDQLTNLRVLNLCGNRLSHFPGAFLHLAKSLSALWISENQASPKVHLQLTMDSKTDREVATCILLPQQDDVERVSSALDEVMHRSVESRHTGKSIASHRCSKRLSFNAASIHPTGAASLTNAENRKAKISSTRHATTDEATPLRLSRSQHHGNQKRHTLPASESRDFEEHHVTGDSDEEQWSPSAAGEPFLIKPYATVDLETLQQRLREEERQQIINQPDIRRRPVDRCQSVPWQGAYVPKRKTSVPLVSHTTAGQSSNQTSKSPPFQPGPETFSRHANSSRPQDYRPAKKENINQRNVPKTSDTTFASTHYEPISSGGSNVSVGKPRPPYFPRCHQGTIC